MPLGFQAEVPSLASCLGVGGGDVGGGRGRGGEADRKKLPQLSVSPPQRQPGPWLVVRGEGWPVGHVPMQSPAHPFS